MIFLDDEYVAPSGSLSTKPISHFDNSINTLSNNNPKNIHKRKISSSEFQDTECSNDLSNKMQSIQIVKNSKKSETTQDDNSCKEDQVQCLQVTPTTKSEIFEQFSLNDITDVDSLERVATQGRQPGIQLLLKDRLVTHNKRYSQLTKNFHPFNQN
jgi:hypothetical protein